MKGRISLDGHQFANEHEYKRYLGIRELTRTGRLSRFEVKPSFPLIVNEVLVDTYTPTFKFLDPAKNEERIIQVMVSGIKNPLLELRIKLFEALYGFHIERW